MGQDSDIRIVLSTLRYKSSPDVNYSIRTPLSQTNKEIIEFVRTIDVQLEQVFNDERQSSFKFRPTCKFQVIFENKIVGFSNYTPFENNLYYVNEKEAAIVQCSDNGDVNWSGYPQYNEFDFIRNDYNVLGYTQPSGITNECHLIFESQSASTYNWNTFLSYPFSSSTDEQMFVIFRDDETTTPFYFKSGDGIPFIIKNITIRGDKLISFRCPVKHGLKSGEFVQLSFPYNTNNLFQVYSLGGGDYVNQEYMFTIYDVGFTGNTFSDGVKGTFKRVIDDSNINDTISSYYVRKHKILTNVEDSVLVKSGFDNNIFGIKKKYERQVLTPNKQSRVSVKEGSQSYNLSFNVDVVTKELRDNQRRPVTELFFTVIWKGFFGWTIEDNTRLQQGWEFNLPLINNQPNNWWNKNNNFSYTNFNTETYSKGMNTNGSPFNFNYVESLKSGDILDGDFCEWNNFEQNERVISELYHKFKFNQNVFTTNDPNNLNRLGYYYQPHHPITLRVFSDYIETGNPTNMVDIPDYSYYSTSLQQFIWRDIYDYGFIDGRNRGLNYPFLNGTHYPFVTKVFRIIPEGSNYSEQNIIFLPIIDYCE